MGKKKRRGLNGIAVYNQYHQAQVNSFAIRVIIYLTYQLHRAIYI